MADDTQRAFLEFFRHHERAVLAYALRRAPTPEDAEDAAAETFAIAWRRTVDIPKEPLPWLYGVARRVLANQRRGHDRRSRLVALIARQPLDTPTPTRLPRTPAIDALERLRADDQELLRLVAWEGLRHAEIAAVLGISENAVAIRLHRARRRFEQEFGSRAATVKGSGVGRTHHGVKGNNAETSKQEEV